MAKDLERGFFPGGRTDRFDWQKTFKVFEGIEQPDQGRRKDPSRQKSTEGKWENLIEKTEQDASSRIKTFESISSQNQISHRVMKPELLEVPKLEGKKFFQNIVYDTWQQRQIENHERVIQQKYAKKFAQYQPIEGITPTIESKDSFTNRDSSRISRNTSNTRDQSIIYSSNTSRSITPSNFNRSNLMHGLVPSEEKSPNRRILRNPNIQYNGASVKNLLVPQITDNLSKSSKPSTAKFIYEKQKQKAVGEDSGYWNEAKSTDAWKKEIQIREEQKYGRNCNKEQILADNVMFQMQEKSQRLKVYQQQQKQMKYKTINQLSTTPNYSDFCGESVLKADLKTNKLSQAEKKEPTTSGKFSDSFLKTVAQENKENQRFIVNRSDSTSRISKNAFSIVSNISKSPNNMDLNLNLSKTKSIERNPFESNTARNRSQTNLIERREDSTQRNNHSRDGFEMKNILQQINPQTTQQVKNQEYRKQTSAQSSADSFSILSCSVSQISQKNIKTLPVNQYQVIKAAGKGTPTAQTFNRPPTPSRVTIDKDHFNSNSTTNVRASNTPKSRTNISTTSIADILRHL